MRDSVKALICDDDAGTRLLVSQVLSVRFGWECLPCADGQEALDTLERHRVDVAVVDIHMPRVDGVALVRHIRGCPRWSQLPVVMLTAEADEDAVGTLLMLGISDYIVKPLNPDVAIPKFARVAASLAARLYDQLWTREAGRASASGADRRHARAHSSW
jgi:DNA-binding response OmpR family regulator